MTGDNLEDRCHFRLEFWPSEWQYEPQRLIGSMDAPDWSPAGAMEWHAGKHASFPVTMVVSRGAQ